LQYSVTETKKQGGSHEAEEGSESASSVKSRPGQTRTDKNKKKDTISEIKAPVWKYNKKGGSGSSPGNTPFLNQIGAKASRGCSRYFTEQFHFWIQNKCRGRKIRKISRGEEDEQYYKHTENK